MLLFYNKHMRLIMKHLSEVVILPLQSSIVWQELKKSPAMPLWYAIRQRLHQQPHHPRESARSLHQNSKTVIAVSNWTQTKNAEYSLPWTMHTCIFMTSVVTSNFAFTENRPMLETLRFKYNACCHACFFGLAGIYRFNGQGHVSNRIYWVIGIRSGSTKNIIRPFWRNINLSIAIWLKWHRVINL